MYMNLTSDIRGKGPATSTFVPTHYIIMILQFPSDVLEGDNHVLNCHFEILSYESKCFKVRRFGLYVSMVTDCGLRTIPEGQHSLM